MTPPLPPHPAWGRNDTTLSNCSQGGTPSEHRRAGCPHVDALTEVNTFSGSLGQAQVLPARASLKTFTDSCRHLLLVHGWIR
jgi:hypothetical protein